MTLALAMLLDAIFGEPKWLWSRMPHPAVMMGQLIGWCDKQLNHGRARRTKGVLVVFLLVVIALALGWTLAFHWVIETLLVAILLAQKSLVDHVKAVASGLALSVEDGKAAVAMIVGRDTRSMDESSVARAAIESAAENFSDGIIAPLFWYLIGGLPGILIYKMMNTADSMIGYRTPRHKDFGWAAARLDDVLNWVPARLTAFLMAGVTQHLQKWRDIAADARLHRSPNAGWPEAAMARAIDIALSGPRSYGGEMHDFPFVHNDGRKDASSADIDSAVRVLWLSWCVVFVAVVIIAWISWTRT